MRTHIRSTPLPVSTVCFIALVIIMLPATSRGETARAADECAAAPNAPPPAGQHWWYRTDRATKRKCWYLGPQDQERAARKADRQERAQEQVQERAAAPAMHPASTQDAPSAPVAGSDTDRVQAAAPAAAESVPFLVDWSDLLEEAGIVSAEDNALTRWADDTAVRTAFAMQDQRRREPVEPRADTPAADKDDARVPQTVAGPADVAGGVAEIPARVPASVVAALLLAGILGGAIVNIVRTRRRRQLQRAFDIPAIGAWEGALPSFLQSRDAPLAPTGQDDGREHDPEPRRAYGGEEELRRILGLPQQLPQRRAA